MKAFLNHYLKITLLLIALMSVSQCKSLHQNQNLSHLPAVKIPIGGNAFFTKNKENAEIHNEGIKNWDNPNTIISVYFKASKTGTYHLQLEGQSTSDNKIKASVLNQSKTFSFKSNSSSSETLTFKVNEAKYVRIDLQGISKSGAEYVNLENVIIKGTDAHSLAFVKDNSNHRFHFGRRGPSVHLKFSIPEEAKEKVEYFYNEIRVPKGEDVIGSYFMANGFSYGYFGIQVNSETERRVLFSVWSPFSTDNPNEIPEEDRINLIRKGKEVYTGEFGNEGSGGQSFLRYHWEVDRNYAFLLKASPNSETNRTVFTAYFKEVGTEDWKLIASFSRPKTNTYLKNLYSFLENFVPDNGNISRKVLFTNQWIRTTEGIWKPIDKMKFTGDDIARIGQRLDYAGGTEGNNFYLKNCGFFDDNITLNTDFTRSINQQNPPKINFNQLP